MRYNDVFYKFQKLADPKAVEGMARYGIRPKEAYGISIPNLRIIAKEIGTDHELALDLWESGIHEARILAGMIDDPDLITERQIDRWVGGFDSWDICDQCCMNAFERTRFARNKALEWSASDKEYVKRAGFVMMARLALVDKKSGDEQFSKFLEIIEGEACDSRNYVQKAVNWALRQIGKRNANLNRLAVETAEEIQKLSPRSAKWIASDALRELKSETVQARLRKETIK
ncbi:MAG: DNA alkylation repair protein [Chloroflexota bacterium]|nr:DNA alkylation repair protein [Chloroflexota bacterium]